MRRRVWLLVVLLLVAGVAGPSARQATAPAGAIVGVIVDAVSGAALPGVRVEVSGTETSALTDASGRFRVSAPAGRQVLAAALVGYGLGRLDVTVPAMGVVEVRVRLAPGTAPFTEQVTVRPEGGPVTASSVASFEWHAGDLLATRGVLADDPLRAVQTAPEVTASDDFRAEIAVRGHGWRQLGITLDGMDTRLLVHSVRGVADTGSLAIFNTDVLGGARLDAGARAQRDRGALGARLTFDLRDGARDRFTWRASASGTAASALAEGPLDGDGRASFLVSVRQSYLDWLLRQIDPEADETFGFVDGLARVSWQASPRQLLRMTVIGARSELADADPDDNGPNGLDTGRSLTTIGNIEWQLAPRPELVLTHRLWIARSDYRNVTAAGGVREAGDDRELAYRSDVLWQPRANWQVEGGVRLGTSRVSREAREFGGGETLERLRFEADDRSRAAWGQASVRPVGVLRLTAGARVEWSRTSGAATWSPWVQSELQVAAGTVLRSAVARLHQHPSADQIPAVGTTLVPESGWLADVGVDKDFGAWTASAGGYVRSERDGLRDGGELLVSNETVRRRIAGWQNRFDGRAAGLELVVRRRAATGLSGWAGYALSHYRQDDLVRAERFDADHDQRHGLSAVAVYRRSATTSVSARVRVGSGTPLAGYYDRVGDSYYLSDVRNAERLSTYARVDARADHAFALGRRRLTLFVEVINLLNRRNLAPGDPSVNSRTGVVRDAVEELFPILPSVGFLFEW